MNQFWGEQPRDITLSADSVPKPLLELERLVRAWATAAEKLKVVMDEHRNLKESDDTRRAEEFYNTTLTSALGASYTASARLHAWVKANPA